MIRIWEKYRKLEIHTKAMLWFTFANVMQKGAAIIGTPVFTRLMSKQAYGVTTVYQSWLNIFSVFVTLNLSYGMFSKGLEKFEDKRSEFTVSIESLSVFLAAAWLGVFFVFRNFFIKVTGMDEKLLFFMFFSFLTVPLFDLWAARQRYEYHYKKLAALSAVNAVVSILLPIAGIFLFPDPVLTKIVLSNLCLLAAGTVIFAGTLRKDKNKISFGYWKYAIQFNLPLVPYYLSIIILNHSDRIMIQKLCGDADAGMYSVAHQIGNILLLITSAITSSFTPFMYQNIKTGKTDAIRKNTFGYLLFAGSTALLIIMMAPEFMKIFASKSYFEAVYCIPPLVIACFIQFSYSFFGTIEFYYEKTWFTLVISTGCTLLNIFLNFVFIPIYGYIACAYTTLFSFSVMALGHFIYSGYLCRIHLHRKIFEFPAYAAAAGSVMLLGLIIPVLYKGFLLRYIMLLILMMTVGNRVFRQSRKE